MARDEGCPIGATRDIDVTPERPTGPTWTALSAAVKELGARIRAEGAPGGVPFDHEGASLARAAVWNLVCRHGELA